MPSPPLGRVWRQRSSEVGIFHSGGFAEYVSGGFVHFTSGDDTSEIQREALLKGDEGKRQEALAMVQSLQQQIAAVDRDIKFLEEEQSKVEAMHIEFKLKEIERQKEAIQKELEPYRKAYEDAKTAFKKAEPR